LFAPPTYGVVLRAHSVRGEPRIQRNASGGVATIPFTSWGKRDTAIYISHNVLLSKNNSLSGWNKQL